MAGPAAILREVHQLHQTARGLREQLDRFPYQLKAQKAKVARQEEALRQAQEALKKLKVRTHELEVELRGTHQKVEKYTKQQREAITNKREFDALQTEITNARDECKRLEDKILAAMGETEEGTAALPGLEQALAQGKLEAARFEETARERQATLGEALAGVQQQLKEAEARIPEEVRAQYDRVVGAMGAGALAAARGGACGACSTELTAQTNHELLLGAFVVCAACGRFLYPPE